MNVEKRAQEIRESIKSCSEDRYLRTEILPQMLGLQRELVELTFNSENVQLENLRLWDVENHLTKLSEEHGNAALTELLEFKNGCKQVGNLIRAEMSGNWGEEKAFCYIERIRSSYILLKNVALNSEGVRTEIDAVVLTKKGAFIVEVKNTKKNIFIDENGDYYRVGEYSRWDSNIGEKLRIRKRLLNDVLVSAGFTGIDIYPIVVFTNNKIEVKNRNKEITTCFLTQLPYSIAEQTGKDVLNDESIRKVANAIEEARSTQRFSLDFNAEHFKQNFAVLMAKLEETVEAKKYEDFEPIETVVEPASKMIRWRTVLGKFFSRKNILATEKVAAMFGTIVTAVIMAKNNY